MDTPAPQVEWDSAGPVALTQLLLGSVLELGDGVGGGALTLFPLLGGIPAPPYLVSADAIGEGLLRVTELGGGSISNLLADNRADLPILLIGGEHLQGARQDRMVNASVLLAPSSTAPIPVSCVERGRWFMSGSAEFGVSPHLVSARLRTKTHLAVAAAMRGGRGRTSNQTEVWAEVADRHAQLIQEPSPTDAVRDTFMKMNDSIERLTSDLGAPDPEQTGVVACIGGRPVAMDCFDKPETLRSAWARLVRGYAMDALGIDESPVRREVAESFVQAGAGSDAYPTTHQGVGIGTDVLLTAPGIVVDALVWNDGVVHTAVFASEGSAREDKPIDRLVFYRRRAGGAA